ncbi:MAG: nucleoid-associated protein [Firmicutes bacterium]|nr:nucleoid-associated protein [Bacillota bacterium]
MIVSINSAILHILDSGHRMPMLSERPLDIEDAVINTYITSQIERVYDDPSHRSGEFRANSGFKYHINELKDDITDFSRVVAERLFEGLCGSDKPEVCDIIVCDLIINERKVIGILKLNNKVGFTHQVIKDENGIFNNLINHYAILPNAKQKTSEYAFIDRETLDIRYHSAAYKIEGEKTDLFADILLECDYEISSREAVNTAKKVTAENGGDELETVAKIKECVIENIEENKNLDTKQIAEQVFDGRPVMREEFKSKMESASVPEEIEINKYVTKKITSNIRLTTDTGIEISFPSEYYRDNKYVDIINNDDGTISIQINNISELINK